MFCSKCGNELNDGALFCPKCGLKIEPEQAAENTADHKESPKTAPPVNTNPSSGIVGPNGLTKLGNPKSKSGKIVLIAVAAIVTICLVIVLVVNSTKKGNSGANMEGRIANLTADVPANAEEIVALYEEYDQLSDSKKEKISNRESLLNAYSNAVNLIGQWKNAASEVDSMISAIDTQNIFAEASTVKNAVGAYNSLDEYACKYVSSEEYLRKCYDEVKDLNMSITGDNFFQIYNIQFAVAEKTNNGGYTSNLDGFNWDADSGYITPDYSYEAHSDYYTPILVYVSSKYPNLSNACSFDINLHQTYQALGLMASGTQEFDYQSRTINYDSSMGIGEYMVPVEINNAGGGLLDAFGFSFDLNDLFHEMDSFDPSRVEYSNISGSIQY